MKIPNIELTKNVGLFLYFMSILGLHVTEKIFLYDIFFGINIFSMGIVYFSEHNKSSNNKEQIAK